MKFRKVLSLLLSATMLLGSASFAVSAADTAGEEVSAGSYANGSFLENYAQSAYNETGLGSVYSKSSTTGKMWSPNATSVKLKLYKTGSDSEAGAGSLGVHNMTKNSSTGVWSIKLDGDYKSVYYTYEVTAKGFNGSTVTNETQDVYSQATGVNGARSMVVDLDSTDPEGWDGDKHVLFDNAGEAVVWEVHVRDFSASATSGVSEENRGKYLAFAEGGTKLNSSTNANAVSTGIDYLVQAGVNCVQLQPVYDFESVDETKGGSSTNRNWGYDPQNYNVPEGSYSSDAYDGNVRVKEFKQMVQALHDRGISVVMDVVYNHTYKTEGSCFAKSVPGYYYRQSSTTAYNNGSGCGNETASDKLMFRKYMIDSCKYWASEYHIDGFRFDLMGLHDVETMNNIRSALDGLYSDGSGKKILMYGEPWSGDGKNGLCPNPAIQSKASSLNSRVGMFSDSYRDAIKGSTDGTDTGFIQGNTAKTATVVSGIKGKGFNAQAPSQTIAYADAHDNLILWDKILKSNGQSNWNTTTDYLKGEMKGVMTLLLTSQGIPFMTAGSEFCRTKKGDKNSYKSSDDINAIDWSRVQTYSDVANYYKGLAEIRKHYTPLHTATFTTPSFQSSSGNVVAYTYSNSRSGEWGNMCVLVNGGSQQYTINLSGSNWTVVANQSSAGLKNLGTVSGSSYGIPAHSAAILVQNFGNLKNAEAQFGTLTVKHVDDKGNTLKTSTAKYRAGSTYRAMPDSSIAFDHELLKTEGTVSGTVAANQNYNVTFTYSSQKTPSGYVTVNYVGPGNATLRESDKTHLRKGEAYDAPAIAIQGYQLDTTKFPANTKGTFDSSDINITYTYKNLDSTTTTVHYYNTSWSTIRCYAYDDAGKEVNGKWASAGTMQSEGSGWWKCTLNTPSAYVMFHNGGTSQEPGQGESGYPVAGETWIQNKQVTFNCKVITSHIDLATGQQLANDVVDSKTKTTSNTTYTTSPLAGRDDVIVPGNATGNYKAGVTNVIYLYGKAQSGEKVLIGDVDGDGSISVQDTTLIQKHLVNLTKLEGSALAAADVDGDGSISVQDATCIQKYLVKISGSGKAGQYSDGTYVSPQRPTTPAYTNPVQTTPAPATNPPVVEETTQKIVQQESTFNLTDNLGWGHANIYAWDADGNPLCGEWPGAAQAETTTNDFGETQFVIHVPAGAVGVIANNGGTAQTNDITDFTPTGYWLDGTKNDLGHYIATPYF